MSKLQERLLDEKGNVAVQPQAQQHHVCSLIRVKGVWLRELHFVENARSKFMIDSVILLVTKIRIQTPDKQNNCVRANLNLEDKNSGCILRQLRATAMPVGLYISKH